MKITIPMMPCPGTGWRGTTPSCSRDLHTVHWGVSKIFLHRVDIQQVGLPKAFPKFLCFTIKRCTFEKPSPTSWVQTTEGLNKKGYLGKAYGEHANYFEKVNNFWNTPPVQVLAPLPPPGSPLDSETFQKLLLLLCEGCRPKMSGNIFTHSQYTISPT